MITNIITRSNIRKGYRPGNPNSNHLTTIRLSASTGNSLVFVRHYADNASIIAHRQILRDFDKERFRKLLERLDPIQRQLKELDAEAEVLKDDRSNITKSIRAASKHSTGETPSVEEQAVFEELSSHYSSFFDGEDSEGDEPSMSTLNEIMKLKEYIKKEQKINKKRISALMAKAQALKIKWQLNLETLLSGGSVEPESPGKPTLGTIEKGDSSKGPNIDMGESSKRKYDYMSDSDDSSTSSKSDHEAKRSRPNKTHDPLEDLPELPYNPMD